MTNTLLTPQQVESCVQDIERMRSRIALLEEFVRACDAEAEFAVGNDRAPGWEERGSRLCRARRDARARVGEVGKT